MARSGYAIELNGWLLLAGLVICGGCDPSPRPSGLVTQMGTARRSASTASSVSATRPAQDALSKSARGGQVPSRPVGPTDTQPALAGDEIGYQIPDPRELRPILERECERDLGLLVHRSISPEEKRREESNIRSAYERRIEGGLARVKTIGRARQMELRLADCIRRALHNNYMLQVQAYNPAIETTRIVEAEAQFDAIYFANANYNSQDRPTSSYLTSTATDTRSLETGVRKLLSTGTQVQISYALTRTWTNLVFTTLNPAYFNNFVVEFRQPFLRGFGLDFNRSQIEIHRLDRQISLDRLRKEVQETVFNVEQAYWNLLQARRRVMISAQLLTELETILERLEQRKAAGYDVYGVQLSLTTSRIEQRKVEFIRRCNEVKNSEDVLKSLMNDPELNLSQDCEIIPIDAMALEPLVMDELGELSAALTHRPELHEARHLIEQAQLAIGVAKNQAMPKLDAMFRYLIDGLGDDPHGSFSQLWRNDYNEYVAGLEFEYPIGDRGPEAALRRARLQQAQAIASHRAQIENVLREVRQAIRDLGTGYEQIGPSLRAAAASRDQLRATKARQEKLDPPSLQVELDANESLAASRDALLQTLVGYNISLVNLERRKGTLLQYNNIYIRGEDNEGQQTPYRPAIPGN